MNEKAVIGRSIIIDETICPDNSWARTKLEHTPNGIVLGLPDGTEFCIPPALVISVMERYGREVDNAEERAQAGIRLGDDAQLMRFSHRSMVDACARDYLMLVRQDAVSLAAIARTVSTALTHLTRSGHFPRRCGERSSGAH